MTQPRGQGSAPFDQFMIRNKNRVEDDLRPKAFDGLGVDNEHRDGPQSASVVCCDQLRDTISVVFVSSCWRTIGCICCTAGGFVFQLSSSTCFITPGCRFSRSALSSCTSSLALPFTSFVGSDSRFTQNLAPAFVATQETAREGMGIRPLPQSAT